MTTIIIIVVVALVFFVTVCVVTFMVWKREAEIRTDSIREIESNLKKLGDRLAADSDRRSYNSKDAEYSQELIDMVNRTARRDAPENRRRRSKDPFGWIRENAEEKNESAGMDSFEEMMDSFEDMYRKTQEDCEELFVEKPVQTEELKNQKQQETEEETAKEITYKNGGKNKDDETKEDSVFESMQIDLPELEEYEDKEAEESFGEISLDGLDEIISEKQYDDVLPAAEKMLEKSFEGRTETHLNEEEVGDSAYIGDRITAVNHMRDMDIPEFNERLDDQEPDERRTGHDIGRSGKKYTAEELDMLIKE